TKKDKPNTPATPRITSEQRGDPATLQLLKDISRKLAFSDDRQYGTIAEYYADVQNPLYQEDESYRALVEQRLEASKHLYENSPHKNIDMNGSQTVVATMDDKGNAEVREVHNGYTGGSSEPVEYVEDGEVTNIADNGTSMSVSVRSN